MRGIEARRRQRGERERADDSGDGEAAPALAPLRAAAGGGHEAIAEAVELRRQSHAPYMDRRSSVCQSAPPQAGGTRIGFAPRIEPSPGRPVILQYVKRPDGKSTSAR